MSDTGLLAGKVAIVTGGSRGIGRAIVEHFMRDGATVVDASRSPAADRRECVLPIVTDVAEPEDIRRMVDETMRRLGGIDVLVNNAALELEGTIEQTDADAWDRLMHVNLRGPFLCAKYALPALRERRGTIINIASVDGYWAEPSLAAYCASKGGLMALMRAIAVDHGPQGVRCTAICPSYVRTDMLEQFFDAQPRPDQARADAAALHPICRLSEPDEIASLAAWLASDQATFATGQAFVLAAASPPAACNATTGGHGERNGPFARQGRHRHGSQPRHRRRDRPPLPGRGSARRQRQQHRARLDRPEIAYEHVDVTVADDVQRLVEATLQRHGRLHVLVNNAGIEIEATVEHTAPDDWDRVMAVNVRGPFLCSKYAIDALRATRGVIINMASINAFWAEPQLAAYSASKAAVLQLTRCMALDPRPRRDPLLGDLPGLRAHRDARALLGPPARPSGGALPAGLQASPATHLRARRDRRARNLARLR